MNAAKENEIELRWLATSVPNDRLQNGIEMIDRYIPVDADHCHLRIRKAGNKLEITKKLPSSSETLSELIEYNIPLTESEYQALLAVPAREAAKMRYEYRENGAHYQIGIFGGALTGLILVDVEFNTVEDRNRFVPPPWLIIDVTEDKRFAGGELCGKSFSDISDLIESYGAAISGS